MNKYKEAFESISDNQYQYGTDEQWELLEELVNKAIPKKPNLEGDGYDEQGQLIYDTWICPNCEKHYELDYDEYDYCPNCGQKILWSDEDE